MLVGSEIQPYMKINYFVNLANKNGSWNFNIDWNENVQFTEYNQNNIITGIQINGTNLTLITDLLMLAIR